MPPRPFTIDCFTFNNELVLLELRLRTLEAVVDRFVLVEATRSHTGRPKALIYEEQAELFSAWSDRIRHVVVRDLPLDANPWVPERFQRNAIRRGLEDAPLDALVLVSDIDEIPRAAAVAGLQGRLHAGAWSGPLVFEMQGMNRALNERATYASPYDGQYGTVAFTRAELRAPEDARGLRLSVPRDHPDRVLRNAGWHFSFLGDGDAMRAKLDDYAHQETNRLVFRDEARFADRAARGRNVFGTPDVRFRVVPVDSTLPEPLLTHSERFGDHIRQPAGHAVDGPYTPAHARLPEWEITSTDAITERPVLAPILYDVWCALRPAAIAVPDGRWSWVGDVWTRAHLENPGPCHAGITLRLVDGARASDGSAQSSDWVVRVNNEAGSRADGDEHEPVASLDLHLGVVLLAPPGAPVPVGGLLRDLSAASRLAESYYWSVAEQRRAAVAGTRGGAHSHEQRFSRPIMRARGLAQEGIGRLVATVMQRKR